MSADVYLTLEDRRRRYRRYLKQREALYRMCCEMRLGWEKFVELDIQLKTRYGL